MKNHIYYIVFFCSFAFGQQNTSPNLISSAGSSLEGWGLVSLKMDFSIGEIIIDTGFSDEFIITQGFHQENLHLSSLIEDTKINLTVFPNPTNSFIHIDLLGTQNDPIQIDVFDVSGKQWGSTEFMYDKKHSISLQGLAEGIYFLLLENKNFKNIYKIYKTK